MEPLQVLILIKVTFDPPSGPHTSQEAPETRWQHPQDVGMPQHVEEEPWLQVLPEAGQLTNLARTTWMVRTFRIGPDLAHIDIADAFEGRSLLWRSLSQHTDIFIW